MASIGETNRSFMSVALRTQAARIMIVCSCDRSVMIIWNFVENDPQVTLSDLWFQGLRGWWTYGERTSDRLSYFTGGFFPLHFNSRSAGGILVQPAVVHTACCFRKIRAKLHLYRAWGNHAVAFECGIRACLDSESTAPLASIGQPHRNMLQIYGVFISVYDCTCTLNEHCRFLRTGIFVWMSLNAL